MPVGNEATRFPKGKSANPGGKTSAQRKLEVKNAESATRLRNRMLHALEEKLLAAGEKADATAELMIEAAILKLLKDAEDRGLGSPLNSTELTGKDGAAIQFEDTTNDATAFASRMAGLATRSLPEEGTGEA